jgi:hypothetical protein
VINSYGWWNAYFQSWQSPQDSSHDRALAELKAGQILGAKVLKID